MAMQIAFSCLALLGVLTLTGADKTKLDEDGIYDFREDKAFDKVIEGRKVVAVFFHDPHRAASESVLHEYRAATKELVEASVDVGFGVVDTSNGNTRGLLRRFGIFKVPTFLVFHDSVPYPFYGNLTRTGIVEKLRQHAEPDWKSDHAADAVQEVTAHDVNDFIQSRRAVMLMFYAPWCNHCKQMEPAYLEAAEAMQSNQPAVHFGRLDGSKFSEVSTRFNVSGFPTLLLFRSGVETRYNGARSALEIAQWVRSRIAPASKEMKPILGAAKKSSVLARDAVVVGFFAADDVPELVAFHELADGFRNDVQFNHVVGEGAMAIAKQEFGAMSDTYAFVLVRDVRLPVRKGEEKYVLFEGESFDPETGREFLIGNIRSLVNFGTKENWMKRFAGLRPLIVMVTDVDWEATRLIQYEIDQLAEVAEKYPDVSCAIVDPEELEDLVSQLGLGDHDEDAVATFLQDDYKRFPLPGRFTAQSMIEHLERHARGELKPYLRSQKEPPRNLGPLRTLVASAFDRLAGDTSKSVVTVFISQVSTDCQKFEAVLKKVHKQLSSESVLFFRYDIDRNDLPGALTASEISSTPVLVMWPAGRDRWAQPEIYKGRRRVDSILEFIEKHSAQPEQDDDGTAHRDEL